MNVVVFINNMFGFVNDLFDVGFLWVGLFVLLIAYPAYFFSSNLRKYTDERRSRELLSQTVLLILIVFGIAFVWALPDMIWWIWFNKPVAIEANVIGDIQTRQALTWGELAWVFSSVRLTVALAVFSRYPFGLVVSMGRDAGWLRRSDISALLSLAGSSIAGWEFCSSLSPPSPFITGRSTVWQMWSFRVRPGRPSGEKEEVLCIGRLHMGDAIADHGCGRSRLEKI